MEHQNYLNGCDESKMKPVSLTNSGKIIHHLNDDVEVEFLEELLEDAEDRRLTPTSPIWVTYRHRVNNFDPEHPVWEDISETVPLKRMLDLYQNTTGFAFDVDELRQRRAVYTYSFETRYDVFLELLGLS